MQARSLILGIEDPCKRGFWLSGQGKLVVPSGVGENMVISVLEKMILLRFRSIAIYMWCRIWFSKIGLLSFCANLEILVLSNRAVVEGCLNSVFQGRSNEIPDVEAGGGVNNVLFSEEDECLPRSC
ncbi:hypothetical protein U1Q18_040892 [Sarracenia purpurea var. burkii]